MTNEEARKLPLCLARIHWEEGGSSLAAIGQLHDGRRWFAPVNWTAEGRFEAAESWHMVRRVEVLHGDRTEDERKECFSSLIANMEAINARREAELKRLCEDPTRLRLAHQIADAMEGALTYLCN